MTDTNNSGDKTLGSAKPTLHLKRPVDSGTVRQSFSHGRSKVVVVEKKRSVIPSGGGTISLAPKPAAAPVKAARLPRSRPRRLRRSPRVDRRSGAPLPRRRRAPASCCRR